MHKRRSSNSLRKLAGIPTSGDEIKATVEPFQVREALHTIHRAEEFKRDKALMREVKKMAKNQVKAVCK